MAHKCVFCGSTIENSFDEIPYKNRYAHKNCFNTAMKTTVTKKKEHIEAKKKTLGRAKPKAELKDALSEEEYQDKISLFNYLRKLLNKDELPAKIYKLTEDYIKKYEFTYSGILNTLIYYFDLCNHGVDGDCIGIVPYYYADAKEYFDHYQTALNSNKVVEVDSIYKEKKVKIKTPQVTPKLIDISRIGVADD